MSKCPFSNERNCGFCGQSVPEYLAVCGCGYQRAVQRVEEISQENKKLNDFSQGVVAINLSLVDQVSQLRDELEQSKVFNQDHFSNLTNVIRSREVLRAQNEKLEAELKELREKTSTTMGVGSGDGKLFVHGDYESIKAAQAIVLENEKLRRELAYTRLQYIAACEQEQTKSEEKEFFTEVVKALSTFVPNWVGYLGSAGQKAALAVHNLQKENEKFRKENADLTGCRNEYFACLQEEITRRDRLQSQLREAKAECAKLKQINYDVNERAEKIWLLFTGKVDPNESKCLVEISELLEKVSPGWTQAFKIQQDSSVYTVKKLIEDAQKFRDLRPVTEYLQLDGCRYIPMSKVGKYFYQEYKPL